MAALIGSSYERLRTQHARMIYFFFCRLGFFSFGRSINGQQISGRFIAAQLAAQQRETGQSHENVRSILIASEFSASDRIQPPALRTRLL